MPLFLRDLPNVHDKVDSFNALLKSSLDIVAPEKMKKRSVLKNMPWKNDRICQLKRMPKIRTSVEKNEINCSS